MKYIAFLYIIVVLFTINACRSDNKSNLHIQNMVQIKPEDKTLKLSDIFSAYKIIRLEGPSLTGVFNIIIQDSLMIIDGSSENSSLHLYTTEGKYKNHLIDKGRGNNEAFNIQTCRLTNSNEIEILANFSQKLYTYSLLENKITNQLTLSPCVFGSEDFIKLDSLRYVFFKPNPQLKGKDKEYKVNIYNIKTHVIEKQYRKLTENDLNISFQQTRRLHSINNRILFHDVFSSGIYQIYPDTVSFYIYFDKGEYDFPASLLEEKSSSFDELIETCLSSPYIFDHINMSESNKYILSTYIYKEQTYLNVIDKSNMTSQSYTHIYDDLITSETFEIKEILWNIAAQDNIHVFTLEPSLFKEIIAKKKKEKTFERYQNQYPYPSSLAEQLSENDNSLVILFYE